MYIKIEDNQVWVDGILVNSNHRSLSLTLLSLVPDQALPEIIETLKECLDFYKPNPIPIQITEPQITQKKCTFRTTSLPPQLILDDDCEF